MDIHIPTWLLTSLGVVGGVIVLLLACIGIWCLWTSKDFGPLSW